MFPSSALPKLVGRSTSCARAHDSLVNHVDTAAFERLSALLRYVDGDYNDPATFEALGKELKGATRPAHYLAIPPTMFEQVLEELEHCGCTTDARINRGKTVRP
jgi:glucose-6-phosphate 1-dehydrogenase